MQMITQNTKHTKEHCKGLKGRLEWHTIKTNVKNLTLIVLANLFDFFVSCRHAQKCF